MVIALLGGIILFACFMVWLMPPCNCGPWIDGRCLGCEAKAKRDRTGEGK